MIKGLHRLICLLLVSAMIITTSCGKDDDDDDMPFTPKSPDVEILTAVATQFDTVYYADAKEIALEPLDRVIFEVLVTFSSTFEAYTVYLSKDGAVPDTLIEVTYLDLDIQSGSDKVVDMRTFEIPGDYVGSTATFVFIANDSEGLAGKGEIEFMVESPRTKIFEGLQLFAAEDDFNADCFINAMTGMTFNPANVTDSESIYKGVDFGYFYTSTDSATLASPKSFEKTIYADQVLSWMDQNATLIRSTDMVEFSDIERFVDIDDIYEQAVDESGIINHLSESQLVVFENVNGRRGILQIIEIVPSLPDSVESPTQGYIKFDLKVQQRVPRSS